jgi:hypothetical protein
MGLHDDETLDNDVRRDCIIVEEETIGLTNDLDPGIE